MFKKVLGLSSVLIATAMITGCGDNSEKLNIIAGSEIKSIEPLLQDVAKQANISLNIEYTGTIDGVDKVRSSDSYDVAWFGNSKYFYDDSTVSKKIKLSEKTMFSPVIVGVKESSLKSHNIDPKAQYNWKNIMEWVKNKNMTYAMTDPSVSNTGYVALMGVVYSVANKGESVKIQDVNKDALQDFFKGQKLTAKSSKWLMDNFDSDPSIDFVVNYESAILSYQGQNKLIPIYPTEGIVTSDYPALLLNDVKKPAYSKFVEILKSKNIQSRLINDYKYRSADNELMAKQNIFDSSKLLIEMPFNPDQTLADAILDSYFNIYKKPAKFVFVLDTSGSMGGAREQELKTAMTNLMNGQLSKYSTLREREEAIVLPFSSQPYGMQKFTNKQTNELVAYVNSLRMDGGTNMFNTVAEAISELSQDKAKNGDKYRYSVIVMTDGESNEGADAEGFKQWYTENGLKQGDYRVFAIKFGDSSPEQLDKLAKITGGSVFDGQKSLSSAFKEIRSYQ